MPTRGVCPRDNQAEGFSTAHNRVTALDLFYGFPYDSRLCRTRAACLSIPGIDCVYWTGGSGNKVFSPSTDEGG